MLIDVIGDVTLHAKAQTLQLKTEWLQPTLNCGDIVQVRNQIRGLAKSF